LRASDCRPAPPWRERIGDQGQRCEISFLAGEEQRTLSDTTFERIRLIAIGGQGALISAPGVKQKCAAAGAGKRARDRQTRHEQRERNAALPYRRMPNRPSHKPIHHRTLAVGGPGFRPVAAACLR
jgi:hypothetical protein